ncbi:hypothetical protein [Streptomyces qinglanensis]
MLGDRDHADPEIARSALLRAQARAAGRTARAADPVEEMPA